MAPPLGLRPLPFRKVVRRLADFGFVPIGQRGSHVQFQHADGRHITVPHHAIRDLQRGLLMRICRQGRIDPNEFFKAFR